MSKLNRMIIFFCFVVVLMIAGAWNFIQTQAFSEWLGRQTSQQIRDHLGVELTFQSISIDFFPLATRFHHVTAKQKLEEPQLSLDVNVAEFAVILSFFDLLSSKVTIEQVVLKDGGITILSEDLEKQLLEGSQAKEKKPIKLQDIYTQVEDFVTNKIPIALQGVALDQIKLQVNRHHLWVETMNLEYGNELAFHGIFENINVLDQKLDGLLVAFNWEGSSIVIDKLSILRSMEQVSFSGELNDEDNDLWLNLKANYAGGAKDLIKRLDTYDKDLATIDAYWQVDATVNGYLSDPDAIIKFTGSDFKSHYAKAEKVVGVLAKKATNISLMELEVYQGQGEAKLSSPVIVWDGAKSPVLNGSFKFDLKHFYTNDALYYIRDSIDPLKGYVSGGLNVNFDRDGYHFVFDRGAIFENFQLSFDPHSAPILQNQKIQLDRGEFHLAKDMSLYLNLELAFGDSKIEAGGTIRSDYISINASSDRFSFKQFGAISGAVIEGDGQVKFQVDGPLNDVRFYFDLNLSDTKVVDLELGEVQGNLRLDLKDLQLYINHMNGKKGNSRFETKGKIQFEADQMYSFDVAFPRGTYRDILAIYKNFLPVDVMPKGLAFTYEGKYLVTGSLKSDLPIISGDIGARNLTWFNESADKLDASFVFKNGVVNVNRFQLQKRIATLAGKVIYDLKNEYLEYNAKLNNLRLQDIAMYRVFNFGYDGLLEGNFKGDGKVNELITQSKLRIGKGNIFNQSIQDSTLVVLSDSKNVFLTGKILGSDITFDSYLNLDFSNQLKMSYLNASVNTSNVKILTGFISDHNSLDNSINGRISANLESSFNFLSSKSLNLLFEINEFAFRRENIRLVLNPIKRNILIKNGDIRHWDILLKGKNATLQSVGTGQLYNTYDINTALNIDASAIEMIFPRLQKSAGPLQLDWSMSGVNGGDNLSVLRGEANGVSLKIAGIPDTFDDLSFLFQLAGPKLNLQRLKSKFGHGSIEAKGQVDIQLPYPVVNLELEADQTRINFFKNSSVVISGLAQMKGNQPPYDIKSDLSILYGELLDEFSEYKMKASENIDNKYIPKPIDVGFINFFNYDIGVRTLSPLLIRNQIADIQVMGQVHLGGSYHLPSVQGDLSVVQGKSRFQFKGHDFTLTEGKLSLGQDILDSTPSVKLTAVSKVQNYDVKVDVSGKVDNFDLKLTSEPSLSQQDILSLLTLGITSDIANNLDDTGRKSITSLSLGSLIVDQFVLNRGINSSSGIKLSVLPEFGESTGSLLHGRTSGSGSSTRMKSATKVKLQTKLSKKVDLSFSSTLGGTMNQKQEMHVDYAVGNNLTVKGIYEIEDPENGSSESGSSLGIDFNYRKTFK